MVTDGVHTANQSLSITINAAPAGGGTGMPLLRLAEFELSGLSVTPTEIDVAGAVTISVLVTNTGEVDGNYRLVLTVNGISTETRTVMVAGGESLKVIFILSPNAAGTYDISINGLSGKFTVIAPPTPPEPEPTQEPEPVTTPEPEPEPTVEPEPEKTTDDITTEQEPAMETTPAEEDTEDTGVSAPWWTYVVVIAAIVVLGLAAWLLIRKWVPSQA